jgi:4-oxalmesaconate hydratase
VIIDCHGHYTTAPPQLQQFRDAQHAALSGDGPQPASPSISDDEIRETIESNQLARMRERGADVTIFSPKASGMEHHIPDRAAAEAWARTSNDLIARVTQLFPEHFAGVCQLPQTLDTPIEQVLPELRRCVEELGFVGLNLNPDPSGGYWTSQPLTAEYWFPLYEVMVELDVPAMVHVSASCNPHFHATGAHYINADTSAFMQFIQGDLFSRFPELRFIIPHGGGAVPYHWGRYRGIADRLGRGPLEEHVMRNVYFDTCVYHRPGVQLLLDVVNIDNVLFGSEMFGAVPGKDPDTGFHYDDTKRYIDALDLTAEQRQRLFEDNARRVYPRLDARLKAAQA